MMAPYVKEKALQRKIKSSQTKRFKGICSNIVGSDEDIHKFSTLEGFVTDGTLKAIYKMGYTAMTEIQYNAIPKLLEGKDICATAKTGSGKTLAFLIPVVELIVKLKFKPRNGTGAIIISPTREISMQTYGILRELMRNHNQTFYLIMGGTNRKSEAEKLSKGVNILVATPGRLLDHLMNSQYFNVKNLSCLVIDEADRILDFGFGEEMKKIAQLIPQERRQTMLFSATKDQRIHSLAQLFLNGDPLEVVNMQIDKAQVTADGLEQAYIVTPTEKRFLILYNFIKRNYKKKVMVFFNSCSSVMFYNDLLNYISIPVLSIHGKQKQGKRISSFYKFCNLDSGILLCTNIAARGWDIPAVDWIVQYDPPDDPKEYIHRVGRTARAGGQGKALLILIEDEVSFISFLKKHKVTVDKMDIKWDKLQDVQRELEEVVNPNYHLRALAQEAFRGYIRAYDSHSLKAIFDAQKLDFNKVSQCFCLNKVPPPSFSSSRRKKKMKTERKQNDDLDSKDKFKRTSRIKK